MDDDTKLWMTIWKMAAAVLVTLIVCVTGSCQGTKFAVMRMVEAGADPIAASCAVSDAGNSQNPQCAIAQLVSKP